MVIITAANAFINAMLERIVESQQQSVLAIDSGNADGILFVVDDLVGGVSHQGLAFDTLPDMAAGQQSTGAGGRPQCGPSVPAPARSEAITNSACAN